LAAFRPLRSQDAAPILPEKLRKAEPQQLCDALRHAYEKNPEEMPEAQKRIKGKLWESEVKILEGTED